MPPDYTCYSLLGSCEPTDRLMTYALRGIRGARGRWGAPRVAVEAGPLWAVYHATVFNAPQPGQWLFANYDTQKRTRTDIGLSLRAWVLFPVVRVVGIQLGLFADLCSFQDRAGVQLAFVAGRLRPRRPVPPG